MSKRIGLKAALSAVVVALALGWAQAASAAPLLLGATVNVSAYFPDSSSVFQAGSDVVVSGAIEYPTGSFNLYNSSWQVDVTDTQIRITDLLGSGFPYASAAFNGWVLTIVSGPVLTGAAVNAASDFAPVGISIVGNQLFLNYSDVQGPDLGTSIIDIAGRTAVPEPASLTLLGLGLIGLRLARRRASRAS